MDSMRSLNRSLPPAHGRAGPPEELLQAFRTAALSVTNLYKAAVSDQNSARQQGYQEALEDLLNFLDRENLGLQDGEGWQVRQWATERYDGTAQHHTPSDSDDEPSEDGHREQSVQQSGENTAESQNIPIQAIVPTVMLSQKPSPAASLSSSPTVSPTVFHFTGNRNSTSCHAADDMQTENPNIEENPIPSSSSPAPIKVEVMNKSTRSLHRQPSSRHSTRSSNRDFTFTAGTKRKIQFPDFFDISDTGPKEGHGNGKRGRFV